MAAVCNLGFSYFRNFFVKNSNLRLYLRRHAKFGEDWTMHGRVITHFLFSKWRPFSILDFYVNAIFVKKSNLYLFLHHHANFGEDQMMHGQVIAYFNFQNVGHPPSWIIIFSQFF